MALTRVCSRVRVRVWSSFFVCVAPMAAVAAPEPLQLARAGYDAHLRFAVS